MSECAGEDGSEVIGFKYIFKFLMQYTEYRMRSTNDCPFLSPFLSWLGRLDDVNSPFLAVRGLVNTQ